MTELPTDPVELRAWVDQLKSLFRGWANVTGPDSYDRGCRYMAAIRKMIDADDPAAPDPLSALTRAEAGAASDYTERGT